jgi:hypothetical protein
VIAGLPAAARSRAGAARALPRLFPGILDKPEPPHCPRLSRIFIERLRAHGRGVLVNVGTKRMRPDEVVKVALKALDQRTPPPSVITGTRNRLMAQAGRLVSRRRMTMTIGSMMDRAGAGH